MSRTESLREPRSRRGALLEGVAGEVRCRRGLAGALPNEKLSGWRQGPGRRLHESTRARAAAARLASRARSRTRRSAGGAKDRDEGCTNPLVRTLPSVSLPQSPQKDLLESAGPTAGFAFALPQQHFARLRQQDELHAVSDRAASGAREANEKSRARQAAIVPRAKRKLSLFPSILWGKVYQQTALVRPTCCKQRPLPLITGLPTLQWNLSHLMPLLANLFGAAFTLATAYALGALLMRQRPAPPEILLAIGAAAESVLVFLLLLFHLAHWGVFLSLGAAAILAARRGVTNNGTPAAHDPIHIPRAAWIVFLPYGVWYLVNALAPETIADGITYHLGLPNEYLRLGGFPDHVTFFDLVPQGMEMLYTVAFAFGRHAAAKLVEFAFFLATLPLIFRVGRRLGATDLACLVAAVFYFCAPVAGITGSSSYNDAAGVFFMLAAFYLLLLADPRYLLPSGVLAGFCYAIKLPGLMAVAGAVLFVAAQRRWKPVLIVAAGAALMMAPWTLRALVLTGNPVAPLMNSVFPNAYFLIATERELAASLRSLGDVRAAQVPWELAFGDRLTGTFGPLLLALPIGLLALRRRDHGRLRDVRPVDV